MDSTEETKSRNRTTISIHLRYLEEASYQSFKINYKLPLPYIYEPSKKLELVITSFDRVPKDCVKRTVRINNLL